MAYNIEWNNIIDNKYICQIAFQQILYENEKVLNEFLLSKAKKNIAIANSVIQFIKDKNLIRQRPEKVFSTLTNVYSIFI